MKVFIKCVTMGSQYGISALNTGVDVSKANPPPSLLKHTSVCLAIYQCKTPTNGVHL